MLVKVATGSFNDSHSSSDTPIKCTLCHRHGLCITKNPPKTNPELKSRKPQLFAQLFNHFEISYIAWQYHCSVKYKWNGQCGRNSFVGFDIKWVSHGLAILQQPIWQTKQYDVILVDANWNSCTILFPIMDDSLISYMYSLHQCPRYLQAACFMKLWKLTIQDEFWCERAHTSLM